MDSDEDYYAEYSEEEEDFISYDGRNDTDKSSSDSDGVEEELPDAAFSCPGKHYRILNEDDLVRLLENDISTVCDTLCVSRGVACALLCRNNWNPAAVYEDWLASSDDTPPESSRRKSGTEVCTICFDETAAEQMISAACGHPFCRDCWRSYISISINDGPGCLILSCPEPKCKTPVGIEMVDLLCSEDDRKKYHQFLHRSCVESHPARKWCPGPGCDFAVEFDRGESESRTYDVTCDCSFKFCWNCTEESHSPADCEMVAKWAEKNNSEAENTTWILVNTKPCPKCRRSIEKNQGCNHMTCQLPCGFQFCWICLDAWTTHTDFYKCHKYKEKKEEDREHDQTREHAKMHLERYTHFYERFDANDKSWKRALIDSGRARNEHVMTLGRTYNELHGQLRFVVEAWDQIVECRRVLKWSYAYGYYLRDEELGKVRFFEYLQGQAEIALERLHHCAEIEMEDFLNGDCPVEHFGDFRSRLAGLTSVTKIYFHNLVSALENHLSEVQR